MLMCRVFCYIALMIDKGADIALGFIPTVIVLWLLSYLIFPYTHPYFFISTSLLLCLTVGIKMIKKEGYKDIGIGVITGLITFYLFAALLYIAMQGPM